MKTKRLFFALFLFAFISLNNQVKAQTVTIVGNVYLENQVDNSNIKIFFEMSAPSSVAYTVYSNSAGYFTAKIESGIYKVTYSKDGYFPQILSDQAFYSDKTLSTKTIKQKSSRFFVPTDISSIQTAIDYANSNDTVIVEPGVYFENIDFKGKNLVLASKYLLSNDTSYISSTIIDGNNNGHVVVFNSGENSTCQLVGFSVIHGKATESPSGGDYNSTCGGGIYCINSNPTFKNLIIENNVTVSTNNADGAGIYLSGSSPNIINTIIRKNKTSINGSGAGICLTNHSMPLITGCLIENNNGSGIYARENESFNIINSSIKNNYGTGVHLSIASANINNSVIANNVTPYGFGGGLMIFGVGSENLQLTNVTIINNSASVSGSGIFARGSNELIISNCIFKDNNGSSTIFNDPEFPMKSVSISYSDFFTNDNNFYNCSNYLGTIVTTNDNGTPCDAYHNIFEDPRINPNFTLQNQSHCIDAGLNSDVTYFTDINDSVRIWDGNSNSVAIVDMGACEYQNLNIESVQDIGKSSNEITAFPIPFKDNITITNPFKTKIEIYNTEGQVLKTINVDCTTTTINLKDFSSGVYFIKAKIDKKTVFKKIIKQ